MAVVLLRDAADQVYDAFVVGNVLPIVWPPTSIVNDADVAVVVVVDNRLDVVPDIVTVTESQVVVVHVHVTGHVPRSLGVFALKET